MGSSLCIRAFISGSLHSLNLVSSRVNLFAQTYILSLMSFEPYLQSLPGKSFQSYFFGELISKQSLSSSYLLFGLRYSSIVLLKSAQRNYELPSLSKLLFLDLSFLSKFRGLFYLIAIMISSTLQLVNFLAILYLTVTLERFSTLPSSSLMNQTVLTRSSFIPSRTLMYSQRMSASSNNDIFCGGGSFSKNLCYYTYCFNFSKCSALNWYKNLVRVGSFFCAYPGPLGMRLN